VKAWYDEGMREFKCDCTPDAIECRRLRHGTPVSFRDGQDDEWDYFKCGCHCHVADQDVLTQEERAQSENEGYQKVSRWFQLLPKKEASVWQEAYQEDLGNKIAESEEYLAGLAAFMWLARDCGPSDDPWAAIEAVRRKEHKTLKEAEALDAIDAVDGIARKPLSD
jgi:hypothetical protein